MSEKLVLIDGHSILNRAFFGIPDLTNAEGLHTNAVYGFLNILFKILDEEKPDYLTVTFDVHAPTFRHKMFDGYKGTRKPMADELRQQVPLMKEMLTSMGITIIELPGYEADDLLGTLSKMGEDRGMDVTIVSGDRDTLQLASDKVMIRIPKTKKTGTEIENYHATEVQEKYLVTPTEFIDVKALMGDTSDNIPGVPGIGEKTATTLIAQYKSIEGVYEHAKEVKPPRAGKNIVEFWEQAVMSKELATIIRNAPVEYDFEEARLASIESLYTEAAYMMCKRLEFKNFLSRFHVDAPKSEASIHFVAVKDCAEADKIWKKAVGKSIGFYILPNDSSATDAGVEEMGQLSLFATPVNNTFAGMSITFGEEDSYVFITGAELTSDYLLDKLLKVVAAAVKDASFMPRISAIDVKSQLAFFDIYDKNQTNAKQAYESYIAARKQFFDVTVAAYLMNPLKGEYPCEDIAKDHLGLMIPSKSDLLGKATFAKMLAEDEKKATDYACYLSYVAWKGKEILHKELVNQEMEKLFYEIEMPIVFVLSDMEKEGIRMDAKALNVYGEELAISIAKLETKIYEAAGEEFNINSPKQLGVILFEKMNLPNGKKTKTGYSTSAEVLDKLAVEYPIVADILEYRQLSKLKSTYADGLASCVKEDGKIHTTFNQTITATGRLSSTEPNLQNIPIRLELGKLIRKVFYPKAGNVFIDSDYSQIELRVLAHVSGDEQMIEAFRKGQDIHRTTASQVFHVPFEEVTDLQRRNAKAVNFGIVYGISAFGLSQDLNIERKEAQEYIDQYFATYPKIKQFLDRTVEDAKETGMIRTIYGRIRPIPELSSSNFMQRQFGERVAMNSPIQGAAADIIKLAMLAVHDKLISDGYQARLILQVHDELLIEAPEDEKERVIALLEEQMKHAVSLSVDMEVGTECGYNWYDAH